MIAIGNGENSGKFDNGTDQVSGGCSDFGRASNGVAAKIQFHYASYRIVTSRTSWFHNPNKIASLEVTIGRWRPFSLRFNDGTYSAGSVFEPISVQLEENLGKGRNMYATTRKSFSNELHFCHTKVDALLAAIAVASWFSGSDGIGSELNLLTLEKLDGAVVTNHEDSQF